jgi:hypothetical protein
MLEFRSHRAWLYSSASFEVVEFTFVVTFPRISLAFPSCLQKMQGDPTVRHRLLPVHLHQKSKSQVLPTRNTSPQPILHDDTPTAPGGPTPPHGFEPPYPESPTRTTISGLTPSLNPRGCGCCVKDKGGKGKKLRQIKLGHLKIHVLLSFPARHEARLDLPSQVIKDILGDSNDVIG